VQHPLEAVEEGLILGYVVGSAGGDPVLKGPHDRSVGREESRSSTAGVGDLGRNAVVAAATIGA
jgi:hypothetical protein